MKKALFLLLTSVFALVNALPAIATNSSEASESLSEVSSISLTGEGASIKWSVDGYSKNGFKVVWSKNENPVYPCREGDQYHYYSEPTKNSDTLTAFSGAGTYYARVCEYLGGKCGKYSNQISVKLGSSDDVASKVACTMEYAPVCGSDGKTYSNKCAAIAAGKSVKYVGECTAGKTGVNSISLSGTGNNIKWSVDGVSAQGFKVVWSKNENPVYPCREGDQYHYRSSSVANSDLITPFSGDGWYYVRVCEYLGGACGIYSNQIKVEMANAGEKNIQQISEIRDKAKDLYNNQFDALLAEIKSLRDIIKEQQVQINYLMKLKEGIHETINAAAESAIKNFIAYGVDENTKKLGEGERAAVMYSYKAAFDKLPATEEEMEDAIKIANGRWPSIVNDEAEKSAKEKFVKIYKREANINDAHDIAAVKIMAYGLRQQAKNRNLNSEVKALKIFKDIFKKFPKTTEEWNVLQAITYSGAKK